MPAIAIANRRWRNGSSWILTKSSKSIRLMSATAYYPQYRAAHACNLHLRFVCRQSSSIFRYVDGWESKCATRLLNFCWSKNDIGGSPRSDMSLLRSITISLCSYFAFCWFASQTIVAVCCCTTNAKRAAFSKKMSFQPNLLFLITRPYVTKFTSWKHEEQFILETIVLCV